MIRIGIDLGGTKIAGIAIAGHDQIIAETRLPTPKNNYAGTIAAIGSVIDVLTETARTNAYTIGVGMPGSVSRITGKVQNANSTWLNGQHFQQDLESHVGRQVRLANDANCLALSEARDGAGQNARSVFGVILGTGCGGGLVINGELVEGKHAIAGEWGHNPLPWPKQDEAPGPQCWCGRHGCLETWISGPALAADHQLVTGQEMLPEQIAALAVNNDKAAMATLNRHLDRCARGLAHLINILDPGIIVVGGGLADLPGLVHGLPKAIEPHVFADQVDIMVEAAHHGPASGVRGAARLWTLEEAIGAAK